MASGSFFKRPAVLLAFALCSVGALVTILGRLAGGPPAQQKRVALSQETGTKAYPAFAPDGQRIAYSARSGSKVEPFHIWIRVVSPKFRAVRQSNSVPLVTADTPRQLTSGEGSDIGPVWSPDGSRIAFTRLEEGRTAYFVTGVDGGSEQQVIAFPASAADAQPEPGVAWMPDGRSLIVVDIQEKQPGFLAVVPIGGGEPKRITSPPEGSEGDSTPAIAPDGTALAFVRSSGSDGADIFLCDLSGGAVRRLTFDDRPIRGISWTRDSRDLLYAANRFGNGYRLLRVPGYGGAPREISIAGRQAENPAVAPAGNRLAFAESSTVSSIWRVKLGEAGSNDERPLIHSRGHESYPAYSPDGKKIADVSSQSGSDELWISDAEGGNRVAVTHLNGPQIRRPQWSSDGSSIIFDASGDQGTDLYLVAASAGTAPKRLVADASGGALSPDGKHIYYQAHGQIWKAAANGGNPEPLSKEFGAGQPVLSPDGKTVYFRFRRSIWQVPAAGGEAEESFIPHDGVFWGAMQIGRKGAYYQQFNRRGSMICFYDFSDRKAAVLFQAGGANSFSVSPDGQYALYPKVDQGETNLVLLENFR